MRAFRFDTAWGEAGLEVEAAGAVVALHPPGGRSPERAEPVTAAPPRARELAVALSAYLDGVVVELARREEVEAWLTAAGVGGFRRDALVALLDVPFGTTISYGALAELAGRPRAARAVGSSCANNPLPIIVPCHRVLPASGRLGSYGFLGPAYKQRLLMLEQAPALST